MFDYHMHSIVSFDGHDAGRVLAQAAADAAAAGDTTAPTE
mgnify:CR=1 FL=1